MSLIASANATVVAKAAALGSGMVQAQDADQEHQVSVAHFRTATDVNGAEALGEVLDAVAILAEDLDLCLADP